MQHDESVPQTEFKTTKCSTNRI